MKWLMKMLGAALITIAVGGMYLSTTTTETVQEPVPVPAPKPQRLTRPQICASLLRSDPGEWDPETDTYPRNLEWERCMGV